MMVLRDLPVLGERVGPIGLRQRRDGADDRLPFGNDSPEPVSRVAPPTLTMRNTSAATANSHTRTLLIRGGAAVMGASNVCDWAIAYS